jgi:hypothetical protein
MASFAPPTVAIPEATKKPQPVAGVLRGGSLHGSGPAAVGGSWCQTSSARKRKPDSTGATRCCHKPLFSSIGYPLLGMSCRFTTTMLLVVTTVPPPLCTPPLPLPQPQRHIYSAIQINSLKVSAGGYRLCCCWELCTPPFGGLLCHCPTSQTHINYSAAHITYWKLCA